MGREMIPFSEWLEPSTFYTLYPYYWRWVIAFSVIFAVVALISDIPVQIDPKKNRIYNPFLFWEIIGYLCYQMVTVSVLTFIYSLVFWTEVENAPAILVWWAIGISILSIPMSFIAGEASFKLANISFEQDREKNK